MPIVLMPIVRTADGEADCECCRLSTESGYLIMNTTMSKLCNYSHRLGTW